jgi:hypothetical protein
MLPIVIVAVILSAIPHPPQDQGSAQKDADLQTTAPSRDSITVPDGTPLTLELENEVSSATAKVGDIVQFKTAHSVRIKGLAIVPQGTAVSGAVVQVKHSRRLSRDGAVKVAAEELILPNGELVTLRQAKSGNKTSKGKAKEVGTHLDEWDNLAYADAGAANVAITLGMLVTKGREYVYQTGAHTRVYVNGPLQLNRGALMKLQPPPYEGPAQVFFAMRQDKTVKLFCGEKFVHDVFHHVRLELNPGNYSFSTGSPKEESVRLEVREDHQYLIERIHKKLFVRDPEQYQDEIDELSRSWVGDNDFTSASKENSCVQTSTR